jgi:molybdopterin converting factor small subunit
MGATIGVRIPASLRSYAGGTARLEVDVADEGARAGSTTVRSILDQLLETHPDLERRVRDEQGDLRPHVNLFVGDDNIRDLSGLATVVTPGGELSIIPAVSGGFAS